jgi:hypothetical protein
MENVIEKLESEIRSLSYCLDRKDWANTGSAYHNEVRMKYTKERAELRRAVNILKKHIKSK